jgi:hypothetical protein
MSDLTALSVVMGQWRSIGGNILLQTAMHSILTAEVGQLVPPYRWMWLCSIMHTL